MEVRPVGSTMETIFDDAAFTEKREFFITNTIRQLNILRSKIELSHGEIRPSNIILVGEDVFLIDWETSVAPNGIGFQWEAQDGLSPDAVFDDPNDLKPITKCLYIPSL